MEKLVEAYPVPLQRRSVERAARGVVRTTTLPQAVNNHPRLLAQRKLGDAANGSERAGIAQRRLDQVTQRVSDSMAHRRRTIQSAELAEEEETVQAKKRGEGRAPAALWQPDASS
jgi:hypothetical protein